MVLEQTVEYALDMEADEAPAPSPRAIEIEIDELRVAQKVAEITETTYFRDLQMRASGLRRRGGLWVDHE